MNAEKQRFPAPARSLDTARGDRVLAPDAAALDDAPARGRQGGIDVFGPGFGFVHGCQPT
jgi:hypothetical protein